MNRQRGIVAALGAILLAALFFFFVWQPKNDEIGEIEAEIDAVEQQQAQLETRLAELREVRADAPEYEAAIVAAESVVPRDIAQASAIRQLQLAADESGVDLPNVTFATAQQIQDAPPGLARIGVTSTVEGGYYQLVDFFRRVEDPTISPRGITWNGLTVTPLEYPTLTSSASGSMYALLPTPPEPEPTEEPTDAEDGTVDEEEAG